MHLLGGALVAGRRAPLALRDSRSDGRLAQRRRLLHVGRPFLRIAPARPWRARARDRVSTGKLPHDMNARTCMNARPAHIAACNEEASSGLHLCHRGAATSSPRLTPCRGGQPLQSSTSAALPCGCMSSGALAARRRHWQRLMLRCRVLHVAPMVEAAVPGRFLALETPWTHEAAAHARQPAPRRQESACRALHTAAV